MAPAAKLKVYCMPAGFYDALVAAPSQKAALRAWGTTTDLFTAGRASIVEDEALQQEALARPGEVVKRPRGDAAAMLGPELPEPFEAKPSRATPPKGNPSKVEASEAKPSPAQRPKPEPAPPPPDRGRLDRAETALAEAEHDLAADLAAVAAERTVLDRREAEIRSRGEARGKVLDEAKHEAEMAYTRAVERSTGGRRR